MYITHTECCDNKTEVLTKIHSAFSHSTSCIAHIIKQILIEVMDMLIQLAKLLGILDSGRLFFALHFEIYMLSARGELTKKRVVYIILG